MFLQTPLTRKNIFEKQIVKSIYWNGHSARLNLILALNYTRIHTLQKLSRAMSFVLHISLYSISDLILEVEKEQAAEAEQPAIEETGNQLDSKSKSKESDKEFIFIRSKFLKIDLFKINDTKSIEFWWT